MGFGVLHVNDIKTSCGCAAGKITSNDLATGETGEVVIEFDIVDSSTVVHSAVVETNDSKSPHLLTIRATPRWPLDVKPRKMHFSLLTLGQSGKRSVEVFAADGESFEIVGVKSSAPSVECRLLSDNGRRALLEVLVRPETTGIMTEHLVLTTNNEKRPTISIPITGNVVSTARIQPSRVLLGRRAPKSHVTVRLRLQSLAVSPNTLSIDSADADWQITKCAIVSEDKVSGESLIDIDVVTPSTDGYHRTNLTLNGINDQVHIPISSYVGG